MIPAFYPAMAYGGTVNVAYNMCKELVKRGHEVTVFTSDAFDKDSRHGQKVDIVDRMKVFYFKNVSNTLAWNRFVVNPGIISCLSKDINNFDIIHLHGFETSKTYLLFILLIKIKCLI